MEIKPPSSNFYTSQTTATSASKQNAFAHTPPVQWKIDQLLQAVITRMTDKQLFLDIQGIKANTPRPPLPGLQVGDILRLQVEQVTPMPQFRIVSLEKAASVNIIADALRNLQTGNNSSQPLFKSIAYVANRPSLRPSPLPAEINAAIRNIFKQIPSPFNLTTASQVKQQLENSGIFLENKIKTELVPFINRPVSVIPENTRASIVNDISTQLHRLAVMLKNYPVTDKTTSNPGTTDTNRQTTTAPPPQPAQVQNARTGNETVNLQNITNREEALQVFMRQLESGMTQLQQTQLQNLNESQAGRPTWLMELPVKDGHDVDVFELRINEDENNSAEEAEKKIWNVTLKFDLNGLGKVRAHIKMQNNHISTRFFSEKTQTLTLFQQNLDLLRNRLNYNGLQVDNIDCQQADMTEDKPVTSKKLDLRT